MSKNLHHANLLIGTPKEARSHIDLLCKEQGIDTANNPDFVIFQQNSFGIEEARDLRLFATRKPATVFGKKFFLIITRHLTREAQNALLKTFEDPFPETYFFLILREGGLIIPTLLSRMNVVHLSPSGASDSLDAQKFLSLPIKERILFASKFVDDDKKVDVFLDDLLFLLRKEKKPTNVIRGVYDIRRLISQTSVAPRLILEHLSLVL